MTTAKPQQVNDQPEAADDLIAELAKLMAQDAQGERKDRSVPENAPEANPAPEDSAGPSPAISAPENQPAVNEPNPGDTPAARQEPFAFRLPGDAASTGQAVPAPRFDFGSTSTPAGNSERQAPVAGSPPHEPAASPDFDLDRQDLGPRPADAAQAPRETDDRDEIGDLIAAELGQAINEAETQFTDDAEEAPAPVAAEPPSPVVNAAPTPAPDSFKVAPVFGLGGPHKRVEPAAVPPRTEPAASGYPAGSAGEAGSDPIQDIETLIGDALRVNAGTHTEPKASPALRSLATPVLPESRPAPAASPRAEAPAGTMSAEDTILAAAAATGARVGWVDEPQETGAEAFVADDVPRRKRSRASFARALAGPALAVVLLLAAGIGLYSVLGLGGGNDGPAPLLTADASPVKETPEAAPAADAATQSVVFNEIAGATTPAEDEQLVSRDQSQTSEVAALPAGEASDEGLVNRKVRTVTVRPDGTIVGGEESLAGAAMLPVERPNVPEVPGAETTSRSLTAAVGAGASSDAAGATAAAAGGTSSETDDPVAALIANTSADALVPGEPAAAVDASGNAISGVTVPVPMPRIERPSAPSVITSAAPTSPVNAVIEATLQPIGSQQQQPAAAATQQAAAPSASTGQAPAYVQLASQRSQEAAQQTAASLQTRFGSLFGGGSLEIQRVDLGERGIYYRVRLPAQSLSSATQICNSVKSSGGDCFTL